MTEPNYRPRPSTATENILRASNTQRSSVVNSYKGISNSPFDNELFNLKQTQNYWLYIVEDYRVMRASKNVTI